MSDPQVVWLNPYRETLSDGKRFAGGRTSNDIPAIVMTPEYRAKLRALVEQHKTGVIGDDPDVVVGWNITGDNLAAAIEALLEATK